jgi:hypothetical protein
MTPPAAAAIFSRIEDSYPRAFYFVDESRGECRDSTEALQEIQGDAFASEKFSGVAADSREFFAGGSPVAAFLIELR